MQTESDWDARCRLAGECGSLMHQLAAAQDHIAHLSNRRIEANPAYLPIESTWHRVPVIVECEIDEATLFLIMSFCNITYFPIPSYFKISISPKG